MLALAASIILVLGLTNWYFGPTMGQPVLADVKGPDVSVERGTELIPATDGLLMRPTDILRLGTNASATLAFSAEPTQINLAPGTELKLLSLASGKRLELRTGILTAVVARQRPFHPMLILTPQAEARVLGTRFTLSVTNNQTRLDVAESRVRLISTSDNNTIKVAAGAYAVVAANFRLAALPATGRILREYWTNLPNNSLSAAGSILKSKKSILAVPDGFDYLPRFEAVSLGRGLRVTERIRGYVHPPTNGLYRFALTTVHVETALHFSRTDRPEDVVQIAFQTPDSRVGPTLQQVTPVPLQAGRKYYVEVAHESDGGADQLTVMWQAPGREPEIIPGEFLSPFPTKETRGK
jgi:hypothetical protein